MLECSAVLFGPAEGGSGQGSCFGALLPEILAWMALLFFFLLVRVPEQPEHCVDSGAESWHACSPGATLCKIRRERGNDSMEGSLSLLGPD